MKPDSIVTLISQRLYSLYHEQGIDINWHYEDKTDSYRYRLSKGDKRMDVSIPVLNLLLQPVEGTLAYIRMAVTELLKGEKDEPVKPDYQETQS